MGLKSLVEGGGSGHAREEKPIRLFRKLLSCMQNKIAMGGLQQQANGPKSMKFPKLKDVINCAYF